MYRDLLSVGVRVLLTEYGGEREREIYSREAKV